MRLQCALGGLAVLGVSCASTPDFRVFKDQLVSERISSTTDMSVYPDWVRKNGRDKINGVVSWPGVLQRVEKTKDTEGRVVLVLDHRYLSVDKSKLARTKQIVFQVSDKGGGLFQCRVLFKDKGDERSWEQFIEKKKVLGCTGKVTAFSGKGLPIVQAQLLESIPFEETTGFVPLLDENGRVQTDEEGRPRYRIP